MANIVYISIGMGSTLHGSLELCRRLVGAQHQVSFVSHKDVSNWLDHYGFPYFRLTGYEQAITKMREDPLPKLTPSNAFKVFKWIRRRRNIRQSSIKNDEIESLIRRLNPDLLLIDIEFHYAIIVAKGLGFPTALIMFFFSTFRRRGFPPLHTRMFPSQSLAGRVLIRWAWFKLQIASYLFEWRRRLGRKGMQSYLRPVDYTTNQLTDLKAIAKHRKYSLNVETDRSHWLRPYMYCNLPILSLNTWELEFPHTPHPNLHYVGPMINLDRYEPFPDAETEKSWRQFKQSYDRLIGNKTLIYCSLGSFLAPEIKFLEQIIQLAKQREKWFFVIGLGNKISVEKFESPPKNALLLKWAPQLQVLKVADCALIHAGISSINECIYNLVPMVVHSTHTVDQDSNAARIEFHRLGIIADKSKVNTRQIELNIETVINDPEIQSNLIKHRNHCLNYEKSRRVVSVAEKILSAKTI